MRIGLLHPGVPDQRFQRIWVEINPARCGPVEWVPFEEWFIPNATMFEIIQTTDRIDTFVDFWIITEHRRQFVNFTVPITTATRRALSVDSPYAVYDGSDLYSLSSIPILSVFSLSFWAVSLTLFAFLIILNSHKLVLAAPNGCDPRTCHGLGMWSWFSHFFLQNTQSSSARPSLVSRVVLLLTGVFALHSISLYQGCLLGQLVLQVPYKPPVSSVDDVQRLISSKQAVLNLVDPSYAASQHVLTAGPSDEHWYQLRLALLQNPPVYENPHAAVADDPPQHNHSITITLLLLDDIMPDLDPDKPDECKFVVVPIGQGVFTGVMLAPGVNQSVIDCLNEGIQTQAPFITILAEGHLAWQLSRHDICRKKMFNDEQSRAGDPIGFIRLDDIFVLWAFGILAGLVALLCERWRAELRGWKWSDG